MRGPCQERLARLERFAERCSVRLKADRAGPAKAGHYRLLKPATTYYVVLQNALKINSYNRSVTPANHHQPDSIDAALMEHQISVTRHRHVPDEADSRRN